MLKRGWVAFVTAGLIAGGMLSLGSAASAQVLERLADGGELRLGFRTDAPPFSYQDGDAFTGYSIEVCTVIIEEIANNLNLEALDVNFTDVTTLDRFDAVADGTIDLLCGASTATLERRQKVNFSIPIYITGVSAVYRTDAPVIMTEVLAGNRPGVPAEGSTAAPLSGRTFGARAETTAERFLNNNLDKLAVDSEIVAVDNHRSGIASVASGEFDAYFADREILVGVIAEQPDPNLFAVTERFFTYEPIAIAMPRGDDDLRLAVDTVLSRLFRSGAILPLINKYWGAASPEVDAILQLGALPE